MTRKDHKNIATVLKETKTSCGVDGCTLCKLWEDIVYRMALMLGSDNPRFKLDKFYSACGVKYH